MTPTRTDQAASSSRKRPSKSQPRRKSAHDAVPGLQKLKSSLRQTRRLLAKDNLDANVRVETERRLKSLQADLEHAEAANKERTIAMKYHKVKFFERQKVIRKINQSKRELENTPESSGVQTRLFELRVDLNYILNYPRGKKYISLFPPEVRTGGIEPSPSREKTDDAREQIRNTIRERMRMGDLWSDPEQHLQDEDRTAKAMIGSERWSKDGSRLKDDGFFGSEDGNDYSG